jgi:hypothetical protein
MSLKIKLCSIVFILFFAGSLFATMGGPTAIEVLGYDPVTRKVFFMLVDKSDSGAFPLVAYFDLLSNAPDRIVWHQEFGGEKLNYKEAVFEQKVNSLRNRLVKLKEIPTKEVKTTATVRQLKDYITDYMISGGQPPVPKYSLKVKLKYFNLRGEGELTAYINDKYQIKNAYLVPGESYAVVILSYIGSTPEEGGYEKQTAALLTP